MASLPAEDSLFSFFRLPYTNDATIFFFVPWHFPKGSLTLYKKLTWTLVESRAFQIKLENQQVAVDEMTGPSITGGEKVEIREPSAFYRFIK